MKLRAKLVDNDRGWRDLVAAAKTLAGENFVKVGVLADDKRGGLHVEGGSLTVAEIAAVQEFGTGDGHIPSRPFLRPTFDQQRAALLALAQKGIVAILFRKAGVAQVLGLMGAFLAAETKKTITTAPLPGIPPPNTPSTARAKAAKGGAIDAVRTLVDTGRMVGAITWQVVVGHFGGSSDAGRVA